MRITFNSLFRDGMRNVETASDSLLEAQRLVSSGKRVERGSDDPSAAAGGLANRAELATVQRYEKAADSVYSRLTVVDTVMSDIITMLTHAQTAVMSAQGTKTTAQREAAAQDLEGVRSAIADDFNASFNGTYLFGGAASTTPPYTTAPDGTVSIEAWTAMHDRDGNPESGIVVGLLEDGRRALGTTTDPDALKALVTEDLAGRSARDTEPARPIDRRRERGLFGSRGGHGVPQTEP